MKPYRTWGRPPYRVVAVHGGPGAPGSIGPVAKEMSAVASILEPFQTEATLAGQITELSGILERHAAVPVVLIGHSWGAWLSYLVAARHPPLVKKLIMVGAAPFEQSYAEAIFPERLGRLCESERIEVLRLIDSINDGTCADKDPFMAKLGRLFARADTFDALPARKDPESMDVSEEIGRRVWAEAEQLRKDGELLGAATKIVCPVVAVHGDYDPHPAEGVRAPLERVLADFRFILLKKCGHEPWAEKHAHDEFFRILEREIDS